jgi:DNA-binding NarL/FixJ family response regulator
MDALSVLIADDHPLFRKGIRALLASTPDLVVAGEATTGEEAIRLAEALQPDVVLMDLQMPGGGGIAAIRAMLPISPHIRILVVTMYAEDEPVFTALRAGARGYILKDADEEEMLAAIRAAGRGEAIFSPAVATRLLDFFASTRLAVPKEFFPTLTDREREILHLIAQGQTNPAIARKVGLSSKTVSNYVSNIFSKLQVADRAQAIIRAREAGMGKETAQDKTGYPGQNVPRE